MAVCWKNNQIPTLDPTSAKNPPPDSLNIEEDHDFIAIHHYCHCVISNLWKNL